MTFLKMAGIRYSVRRFDPEKKIGQEVWKHILEAARLAPSAHNFQSWRALVLNSKEAVEKLPDCTPCHYHAPAAVILGYDREACWKREDDGEPAGEVDAVIAGTQMIYAALDEGVGVTWVMGFRKEKLIRAYHIPENIVPVAILVMGYPSSDVRPSSRHGVRKELEELVTYNDYESKEEEKNS